MDLFNPYPTFELKTMHKFFETSELENPSIQVVWEDYPDNFTQEKIKSVRVFFQKKYNSTNVNVITKSKQTSSEENQNIEVSFNILDKNYQLELIKSYLTSKSSEGSLDKILELDESVNSKILLAQEEVTRFKKWYIKNIEFSNFLSYGQNKN